MRLPPPRGPITEALFDLLAGAPGRGSVDPVAATAGAGLDNEDGQLALFVCYELHYQGFDGVDERWEWDPTLLGFRARLERGFEGCLAAAVPRPGSLEPPEVRAALTALAAPREGPSLSLYLQREAGLAGFREFVTHRSICHLKEADPHTWAIPRLRGAVKAALVEIQCDEYGGGRRERMRAEPLAATMRAELFAATMRGLGLDDTYGAYLHRVPGVTLAISNVMSLFGLHRRWRGALLGHLAAMAMTSSVPSRRYAEGLRRLGFGPMTVRFYEEHAAHEQIAVNDLCGGFAAGSPGLAGDIVYGAACALELERRWADHLMGCWQRGTGSLRAEPVTA